MTVDKLSLPVGQQYSMRTHMGEKSLHLLSAWMHILSRCHVDTGYRRPQDNPLAQEHVVSQPPTSLRFALGEAGDEARGAPPLPPLPHFRIWRWTGTGELEQIKLQVQYPPNKASRNFVLGGFRSGLGRGGGGSSRPSDGFRSQDEHEAGEHQLERHFVQMPKSGGGGEKKQQWTRVSCGIEQQRGVQCRSRCGGTPL